MQMILQHFLFPFFCLFICFIGAAVYCLFVLLVLLLFYLIAAKLLGESS